MKKLLFLLLFALSFAAFGQSPMSTDNTNKILNSGKRGDIYSMIQEIVDRVDVQTAAGTNTYTVTTTGVIAYSQLSIRVLFTNQNTGSSTLNINSLGAITLKNKATGANLSSGDLVAGKIYTMAYDGTNFLVDLGGGSAAGTVTTVSVTTANGVSGSVANATTTPAISVTLGAITPTTVNGVTLSGSSSPTLAVTGTTTVSGTNTGDQTTISGNAATATALATGRTISTSGDATGTSGSFDGTGNATIPVTVVKINGVSMAGLATGILKNTTTTGVPSIAVSGDFPTLNQNTTGSAATLTTPRTINGTSFDGSANITVTAAATTLTGSPLNSSVIVTGTNISSSVALAGSPTTTTQSALDNSSKIATTAYTDAAVQAAVSGASYKPSVRLVTVAALPSNTYSNGASGVGATLTGVGFGALSVDGTVVVVGDFVLVKNEATDARNGIYTVTTVGAVATLYVLTRRGDYDQTTEIHEGDAVLVEEGSTKSLTTWVQTTSGTITVGTTTLAFSQIAGVGAVPDASTSVKGIAKLYTSLSTNTDGAIDQNTANTNFNLKANLASPTFTGTPAAPTASQGDNSTTLATTAYTDLASSNAATTAQTAAAAYSDGKVANAINSGTTSIAPSEDAVYTALLGKLSSAMTVERLSSGNYTLVAADANKLKETNSGTSNNVTIPANTLTVGKPIYVSQFGAGVTTLVSDGTMTIHNTGSSAIPKQFSIVTIIPISTTECYLEDGLSAGDNLVSEGALINSATTKTTPVDADFLGLMNSAASNILAKLSWANLKATMKTYTDTLYPSGSGTVTGTNTGDQTISDATISTTDITTNNASTSKHGFLKKLPNNAAVYMDGTGNFSTPAGSSTRTIVYTTQGASVNPTDATSLFYGQSFAITPSGTSVRDNINIRRTGTITMADVTFWANSVTGTNENWSVYIRVNDATDYLIATLGVATQSRLFTNTSLSISVTAGDFIQIKSINPTWATNPTAVTMVGDVYVEY